MSKKFFANSLNFCRNRNWVFAIALIVMFAISTVMIAIPQSAASISPLATQTTGSFPAVTPSNWINLITQTPNGEYRPTPGITEYPWTSSIGGNPQRTGYTNSPADLTNHTLWCDQIPTEDWSEEVAANGSLYIVNMDQNDVFAVNANTGQTVWQLNLPTVPSNATSTYSLTGGDWNNDNFYDIALNELFAGYGNTMQTMAVGTQSGALEWLSSIPGRDALICPPGTVFPKSYALYTIAQYHAPYQITCYAINYNEQVRVTKVWDSTNDAITSGERLSYYDGKLYGAFDSSTWTTCVNASTGDLIWNYTLPSTSAPGDLFYQHPVLANGYAYYPLFDNKLLCLNAETSAFQWEYATAGSYVNNVAVANGRAYLQGGSECKLYCVNAITGQEIWAFQADGPLEYYCPVIAGGLVYTAGAAANYTGFPNPGTYPGNMYCVNATTGELVWKYLLPNDATFWVLADGNLFATTPFGQVWCWGAGPTTTTLSASTNYLINENGALLLSGSVTDDSSFSQQNPTLQSPCASNVPVILSYVKDGVWTDFATVTTNSAGSYMLNWTPPSAGAYTIVARFEGDNSYYWSSGQTVVQVNSATSVTGSLSSGIPPDYLVAVIVVFAVVIVAVTLILRRRPMPQK